MPEGLAFQTKPQLGLEMLKGAWLQGVPTAWVTGDEVYGDDPVLRDGIAAEGRRYILAVGSATPVWAKRPEVAELPAEREHRTGRPHTRRRLAPGAPRASTVKKVVEQWSPTRWQRLAVHLGEKGPIGFDWGCARVVDSRHRMPSEEVWLLARRSVSKPSEVAYYLSNADADISLATLAHVASSRYTIEQCFEEAKDDVGLDHYEVRTWPSWHRDITLGIMALAWLASARAMLPDEDCFPYSPVLNPEIDVDPALAVSGKKARRHGRKRAPADAGSLERSRSSPRDGDGAAVARAFGGVSLGMVGVAATKARAGPHQPLPPPPRTARPCSRWPKCGCSISEAPGSSLPRGLVLPLLGTLTRLRSGFSSYIVVFCH